jgi:hypothetical protein
VPAGAAAAGGQFLVDRALTTPKALLDPTLLMRIAPTGGMDPVQGSNVKLLSKLLRPGVFNRMAEAKMMTAGKGALHRHRPAQRLERRIVQRAGSPATDHRSLSPLPADATM